MRNRRVARKLVFVLLALLPSVLVGVMACSMSSPPSSAPEHHKAGTFFGTVGTPPAFSYQSGDAGTVTVPEGTFVTSIWAVGGTDGGTLTITPASQTYPTCAQADAGWIVIDAGDGATADGGQADGGPCSATGSTITIPANTVFQIGRPILNGAANELADGTLLIFAGTSAYVVTQLKYGP